MHGCVCWGQGCGGGFGDERCVDLNSPSTRKKLS